MTTPIEEYFQEKTAGWMDEAKRVGGDVARTGAMGAIAGAGATALGAGAAKIVDAITKVHDFNTMLNNNEDLREHFEQNPKFFNLAYSSLRSTSPAFGKDPIIAGHYMRSIMENRSNAGGLLTQAMHDSPKPMGSLAETVGRGALEGAKASYPKPAQPQSRE